MSKMPNFFLNRAQHRAKYPFVDMVVHHGEELQHRVTVINPSINSVHRGQMIEVWKGKRGRETWGTIVEDVNLERKEVLVRDNIGGTKEFVKWVDVCDVQQVWESKINDNGTLRTMNYDDMMKLLGEFNQAVNDMLDEREALTQ